MSSPSLHAPFHDGCRAGELRVQRCSACGHHQFQPRPFCLECRTPNPRWVATLGLADVVSWTTVHVALDPEWAAHVPYIVALVRLVEGPTLMTNLVDMEEPRIGQRVAVRFRARDNGPPLPVFAPVDAKPSREDTP